MPKRCFRDEGSPLNVLSFILLVLSITTFTLWHPLFHFILDMQLTIGPNALYYDYWKAPSDPVKLKVYLYNWTNPEDFRKPSSKPIVKQCGPYSFAEKPTKVDIKWHSGNDTVSYRRRSFYYFDADRSKGNLNDTIVAFNVVAMTAASKTKDLVGPAKNLVSMGLDMLDQQRYVTKTVDELLLSGYTDNILKLASSIPIFGSSVQVPDRFGWFYGNNGSSDVYGNYNVNTGRKDASKRGTLDKWNFVKNTGFFKGNCGQVNGSSGEFYEPNLTPDSVIYLFSPALCRTIPLEYTETVDIDGVKGYKYSVGQRYADNGTIYPENKCYCHGKCHPAGITDVSQCRLEAPLYVSLPHFYQADPYLLSLLKGLQPNKNRHAFYIVVEPKTGATLELVARLQINTLVEPVNGIRLFSNVPRVYFPLIWIESKFRIGSQKLNQLKMIPIAFWSGYAVATFMFTLCLVLLLWQRLIMGDHGWRGRRNSSSEYKSRMLVPQQQEKSELPRKSFPPNYTLIRGKITNIN